MEERQTVNQFRMSNPETSKLFLGELNDLLVDTLDKAVRIADKYDVDRDSAIGRISFNATKLMMKNSFSEYEVDGDKNE